MRAVRAWRARARDARLARRHFVRAPSKQRSATARIIASHVPRQTPRAHGLQSMGSEVAQALRQCTECGRVRRCTSGIASHVPRQTPRAHALQSMGSKIAHAASVSPLHGLWARAALAGHVRNGAVRAALHIWHPRRPSLVRLQEPMDCSPWAQRSLTRQASRPCRTHPVLRARQDGQPSTPQRWPSWKGRRARAGARQDGQTLPPRPWPS
jgi:hypothetical protein